MKTVLEIDKEFEGADLYVFSSSQLGYYVDLKQTIVKLNDELNDMLFSGPSRYRKTRVEQRVVKLEINRVYEDVRKLLDSARVPNPHPRYQTESKTT